MAQTAVSWLIELIEDHCIRIDEKIIEKAKAMEKEQIVEAFTKGELISGDYFDNTQPFYATGENYYRKTYNNGL